jgi:hypothetical protein
MVPETIGEFHLRDHNVRRHSRSPSCELAHEMSFSSRHVGASQPPSDDVGREQRRAAQGCVISSGTTAASNSSPLKNPKEIAASRNVELFLVSLLRHLGGLVVANDRIERRYQHQRILQSDDRSARSPARDLRRRTRGICRTRR